MQDRLFRKVALERVSSPERLDALMQVTEPRGWLMLAVVALFLAALGVWSVTAWIRTTVDVQGQLVREGNTLGAVLYLSADAVQNVTPGLIVLIAPVSVPTQQYGYLQGRVISVATEPGTTDSTTFEVRVELQPDAGAATGYAWTIAKGPNTTLRPKTAVIGTIIVNETHPIARLLPDVTQK